MNTLELLKPKKQRDVGTWDHENSTEFLPIGSSTFINDIHQQLNGKFGLRCNYSSCLHRGVVKQSAKLFEESENKEWLTTHVLSHSDFSASLWALKKDYSKNRKFNYDFYIKAKYFQCWMRQQRVRNLTRGKATENFKRSKLHWEQCCLKKYFNLWKILPKLEELSIYTRSPQYDLPDEHCLRSKQKTSVVKREAGSISDKRKHLYSKLQKHFSRKEQICKLRAFGRWKLALSDKMYKREILTEEYFQWKEEQREKQHMVIASVHYKVNLMSECFHEWRLVTMESLVKQRKDDVARIHYEDKLTTKAFRKLKKHVEECQEERKVESIRILKQVFTKWKEHTSLSRLLSQRKCHLAKMVYSKYLMKSFFQKWRDQHNVDKADRFHDMCRKRRVLKLWNLQCLKRKLQRRLARYHYKKKLQIQAFYMWKTSMKRREEKRIQVYNQLNALLLERYFFLWKKFSFRNRILRENTYHVRIISRNETLKRFFRLWKDEYVIKMFSKHHQQLRKRYLQRWVWNVWRGVVKEKYLEKLKDNRWEKIQHRITIKACFTKWRLQKTVEDCVARKIVFVRTVLTQRKVRRCLYHWRLVTQQELLIKPLVTSRNYKTIARCFCQWIFRTRSRKQTKKSLELYQLKTIGKVFVHWKQSARQLKDIRDKETAEHIKKLQKYVTRWKDYAEMKTNRRATFVECYARHWLDVTQQNRLNRQIHQAEKTNETALQKIYFCKWLHRAQLLVLRRKRLENEADQFHAKLVYSATFYGWIKKCNVNVTMREFLDHKRAELLKRVFQAWLRLTQDEITDQVANFNSHFESMVDKINLSMFQRSASCKRYSMPAIPSFMNISTSSNMSGSLRNTRGIMTEQIPEEERQLVDQYKNKIEKLENMEEQRSCATPDDILLTGFSFGSEYDETDLVHPSTIGSPESNTLPLESSDEKSSIYKSPNQTLELSDDSKFLSASWTDHWKRRYRQSQEKARRRRSLWLDFQPVSCSTARTAPSHQDGISGIVSPSMSRSNNVASIISPRCPKQPEILTCSLPFYRRFSNDENTLMTSGIYSLMTEDDMQSISSSNISENTSRDKEAFLIRTIHHWRSLNVSTVFYAWYKYSSRKKFLRQNHDYVVEKKQEFLMHSMFLQWNRSLYCKQASAEFAWRSRVKKCLRGLREHSCKEKEKRGKVYLATKYQRRSCLTRYFNLWKGKYARRHQLFGMINIRMGAALIKDIRLQMVQTHQTKWNTVKLQSSFSCWRIMQKKQNMASSHYEETIVSKALNAWWCHNMVQESRKKKLSIFLLHHLLKRYFVAWKRKCYCIQQVDGQQQNKNIELLRKIFKAWLVYTRDVMNSEQKLTDFINQRNKSVQHDAFLEWQLHHRQQMVARQQYKKIIVTKIFSSWKFTVNQRKNCSLALNRFQRSRDQSVTLKLFTWWKVSYSALKKYRAVNIRNEKTLLRNTFQTWRKASLRHRCEKHYSLKLMQCFFGTWKKQFVLKKKELFLMKQSSRKWLSLIQGCQTNRKNLAKLTCIKNEITLYESFIMWRRSTDVMLKAKQHYRLMITAKIFQTWKIHSRRKAYVEELVSCHSVKYQGQLLHSAFFVWKNICARKIQLSQIRQNLLMISVHHKARVWYLKTKVNIHRRQQFEDLLRSHFRRWKTNSQNRSKAQLLYNDALRRRFWRQWLHHTKKSALDRSKCLQLQTSTHDRMLQSAFKKWKEAWNQILTERCVEKVRLDIASEHYANSLKERALKSFSLYTRVQKMRRKRRDRICRQCIDKWKDLVAMSRLAVAMYKENLLNKQWVSWRHAYIQCKVAESIAFQDRRKILSDVFLTWLDYTRMRRTIPSMFNTEKKKVWFRKWMSIYNNS